MYRGNFVPLERKINDSGHCNVKNGSWKKVESFFTRFKRIHCSWHKILENKKFLLRERKRHTARRVASTCYAVPVGGTLPLSRSKVRMGGRGKGTPYPSPGKGATPFPGPGRWGYPPSQVRMGGTPYSDPGREYPPSGPGKGVPPVGKDGGTPPPEVEQTHTCENITSRHPSDAGSNKLVTLDKSITKNSGEMVRNLIDCGT